MLYLVIQAPRRSHETILRTDVAVVEAPSAVRAKKRGDFLLNPPGIVRPEGYRALRVVPVQADAVFYIF